MVSSLAGQDASLGGGQNILDGKQSMTICTSERNLATEGAAAGAKRAKGEKINQF
jgi:ABC-type xylose transport system substrate-binding protein